MGKDGFGYGGQFLEKQGDSVADLRMFATSAHSWELAAPAFAGHSSTLTANVICKVASSAKGQKVAFPRPKAFLQYLGPAGGSKVRVFLCFEAFFPQGIIVKKANIGRLRWLLLFREFL